MIQVKELVDNPGIAFHLEIQINLFLKEFKKNKYELIDIKYAIDSDNISKALIIYKIV